MHATVIIPFYHQGDRATLQWTLEGFARQQLASGQSMEVLVGIDGGEGGSAGWPELPGMEVRYIALPRVGAAATRNVLVRVARVKTDLLIFTNADTRPEPDMVQCHIETITQLPHGSLVLGSAPRETGIGATVLDALVDETSVWYSFPVLAPGTWHGWGAANMLNMSMHYAQFVAAGGFPEELRPLYFEDLVLAYRLIGNQPRVYYQPKARVVHRHSTTLDQYLDREEAVGTMVPVLARVAPQCFGEILQTNVTVEALAQRYNHWTAMDRSAHEATYQCLKTWTAQPQSCLGEGAHRAMMLNVLHQLHLPLKRLASRLGFIRGTQLAADSQWQARTPQGVWRRALRNV